MERNETLVEMLHTLFCDQNHSARMEELLQERDDDKCYFYLEKNLVEKWELADHSYWSQQAEKLMTDLKTSTPEEALRSVYRTLDVMEKINELSQEEYNFLIRLLHLYEDS